MARELLLEIGVEEMPAAFLAQTITDMEAGFTSLLRAHRIEHGKISVFATPRRLCLCCEELAEKQAEQLVEKIGPTKRTAHDAQGNPSKALMGFAKGQGVAIDDLDIVTTERGEYYVARKKLVGALTKNLLPELLERFIRTLSFKRTMRWADSSTRFARPIHWLLAIYAGEVVPFSIESIESDRVTYGHRFMSPAAIEVNGIIDYLTKLRRAFVVVAQEERKEVIIESVKKAASAVGGNALINDSLLMEVTFLVEWPEAICGSFATEYLKLPQEVLTTTMMSHQRYFPVVNSNGNLLPYFITITNTSARDKNIVRKGNEKVISARLKDAEFFFHEDQKIPLSTRVEGLKNVVYHSQMGTSYEKVERFSALADYIAEMIAPSRRGSVARAAFLAKADLDTQMVGEFPELQGIMGREYALLAGETPDVATAIYEHYLPTIAGGVLPRTVEGAIVSIADKLDTIVGFWGVGLVPTGTADPYAMRRQALGIINIIVEHGYELPLDVLVDKSIAILGNKLQSEAGFVKREVMEFFHARIENLLVAQGYPADVVDAVCAVGSVDVVKIFIKVKAMSIFKADKDYEPLAIAFKRARNIIKDFSGGKVDASLFIQEAESNLYNSYFEVKKRAAVSIEKGEIYEALKEMARLRAPIDEFFEKIMVMDSDVQIRFNRQSLLAEIFVFFSQIADFSRITVNYR